MTTALVSRSEMEALLGHCMSLLKQAELSKDVVLSVFRILVRLTRHHGLAVNFLEADGLPLMFATMKQGKLGVQGQQNFIIMIMRHIIEDTNVLQASIEREITRWFTQPARARSGDLPTYIRCNSYLGLRDLDAFIASTLKACKVTKYDSSYRALCLALAKLVVPPRTDSKSEQDVAVDDKEEKDTEPKTDKEKEMDSNTDETTAGPSTTVAISTGISEATKKYSSEVSETVISYLVTELLNTRSSNPCPSEQMSLCSENKDITSKPETADSSSAPKDGVEKICLNELLASYPTCKTDLINYTRRKNNKDSLHGTNKSKGNWMIYLLNELIPGRPTVGQVTDMEKRKRSIESNFASGVLVVMCSNSDEEEEKKPNSDLVHVRR
ncbi:hypothetical protein BGZ65_011820, partial [Modicella reniformis]